MKRSKSINLALMRKKPSNNLLKSLALGVAATSLAGCDDSEDVEVVTSILDCVDDTVMSVEQCRTAYQNALNESERIGPKYPTEDGCESEFGDGQCRRNSFGSFTPLMVGYLFANNLWDNDNSARIGSFDWDGAGNWNNMGTSASDNNEVYGITSWSAKESTPLAAGTKNLKLRVQMNQPSSGGAAVDDLSVLVMEVE